MKKDSNVTPRYRVRSALRNLWMRSRERGLAMKSAKYCCADCGAKQSKRKGHEIKVEVHHKSGKITNWDAVIDAVFEEIICGADELEVLCVPCHEARHAKP